ncbi:MAG: S8 family serine peptidase, partial [Bifidobacteriaceae bacterium]|nr:S8 family serine peptidase [Bifidobacteriaceae bacterium]
GSNSGILEGIIWAAEQGAQVINLSLGDPGMYGDGTSYFDQVVNQVAEDYGCLIVVAAGNDADFQTVSTPAVADRALSVGATAQDGYHAWFSSAGPRRGDGAVNPQIVAPGAGAEEVFTDEWGSYTELGGMTGAEAGSDGYVSDYMGTSMAAPLVAGAAALLIESDTTWDADKLRAKLVASAVPAPDEASVFEQGAGVLNIPKALTQSLTTSPTELNLGLVPFPATGSVTKTLTYANAGATAQTLTLEAGLTTVEYLGPVVNTTDPPGPDDSEPANGDGSEGEDGPIAPLSPDHVTLSAQTVTVPAGGVASVDVTVDAEAFQAGYIGGYLTASDAAGDAVLRTPIGLANEPEKHELTVTATGLDGQPLENADLAFDLTVVDLNSFMSVTLQPVDGKASVELVAGGDYLLSAYAATANDTGGSEDLAGLTPLIGFDGPTEVTIDGASAKDFTVPTGQPVDGVTLASTTITIEGDEWSSGFEFGVLSYVDPLSTSGVHIIPPAPADGAEVTMAGWASLAQPKAEAALDACGLDPVPVVDASGQVPTGHSAYGLVDALDGADLPAGAADQAAVVGLSASELADITVDIILAVHERLADIQAAGYGAAVVGTDLPTIGRMVVEAAVNWLEDEPITLPVLVTNQAGTEKLAAAAAQGGSIHTLGRGTPEYLYQLYQTFDPQADAYTLATDDSSTAKVTVHHRAMGSTGYNQDTFWSDYGGVVMAVNAEPASSYVAHLSPETLWTLESYLVDRETGMGLNYFAVPSRLYYADVDVDLTLGSQVHGAGFDTENGATLMRFDDTLFGALPLFVDGQGHGELARNLDNELGYASLDAVLTDLTTGQEVLTTGGEETVYEIWVEGLDPAAHKYRLDATTKSDSDLWSLSTDVTSSWEWVSAAPPPAGGEDPEDADQTGWQTEALLQVWYDLPGLDAYNAGAPNQPIVLHIGDLTDTEPFALDAVTLEASTDGGATWTPVALSDSAPPADSVGATGNEKLRVGLIEADAGEVVSLRSHVAGGTSSFDQTILDAYPVTTSPRDYQTPASWTSCGIESPLPINLTSTVSSAFQAKGQAPDATVTLSLIAPATPEPASPVPMVAGAGAEWRPDAFGDPAVVKLEGVFYGRSASAFAVADAAPADAVAIGTASAEVTLPTSGLEPVSVKVPAGFTVPTSQYGVWVWRIDPASQTAPVAPLIQPGLADAFGLTQSTQVTQMELSVNSKASKTAAKAAKSEGAQVCDSVWLEHGSAGDLWLNDWNSDKPVQVAVTGALYAAKTAGQAGPDAAAGLKPVKQFKLTFAGAGPDNAQTVCHSLAKGLAGAYGFQFGIDLAGQADGAANYLSKGFATNLWDAAATVQVTAADSGALEVTGAADLAPMLALALVLFAAGL